MEKTPRQLISLQVRVCQEKDSNNYFYLVLPWDHDEDLSLAESRMSKLSQVVQVSQAHE